MTLENLLSSPSAYEFEIVEGHLVPTHSDNLSSNVSARLGALICQQCRDNQLGEVFNSKLYYRCFAVDSTRARKPDITFITKARLPENWTTLDFFSIAPDLGVEVLAASDQALDVKERVDDYLSAGVRLVWEVNPRQRTVMIHRLDGTVQKLYENDTLSGEQVIPGFSCRVADFLP